MVFTMRYGAPPEQTSTEAAPLKPGEAKRTPAVRPARKRRTGNVAPPSAGTTTEEAVPTSSE